MKNTAILKNWRILPEVGATGDFYRLYGTIYNDSAERFADGRRVQTSLLLKIDFDTMTAETKNTIYTLGDMVS